MAQVRGDPGARALLESRLPLGPQEREGGRRDEHDRAFDEGPEGNVLRAAQDAEEEVRELLEVPEGEPPQRQAQRAGRLRDGGLREVHRGRDHRRRGFARAAPGAHQDRGEHARRDRAP